MLPSFLDALDIIYTSLYCNGQNHIFDSDLIDTADDEPSRAASQRDGTAPAPATGRKLQALFVQPRRTVRAKRPQPGASLLKPAPAPPVGNMDVSALRELVCRLCKEVEGLKAELRDRGCRVGVSPASPQVAGSPPASPSQQELHRLLQDQQGKIQRELEQLRDSKRCHAAATQQTIQSQEKEMYGALRHDFEADVGNMQQQLGRQDRLSRRSNLVIHTTTHCSLQQLLSKCNEALQSQEGSHLLPSMALQSMATRSTDYCLWHLRLPDGQAKHALFRDSSGFRRDHMYLDDDLTKKQLEGRHSLRAGKLELEGAGHKTWWRRDVLHWADHDGLDSQSPP